MNNRSISSSATEIIMNAIIIWIEKFAKGTNQTSVDYNAVINLFADKSSSLLTPESIPVGISSAKVDSSKFIIIGTSLATPYLLSPDYP